MNIITKGLVVSWHDDLFNDTFEEGVILNSDGDVLYYDYSSNTFNITEDYLTKEDLIDWLSDPIYYKVITHPFCVGPNRRLIDMLNSGDIDSINLAIGIIENG